MAVHAHNLEAQAHAHAEAQVQAAVQAHSLAAKAQAHAHAQVCPPCLSITRPGPTPVCKLDATRRLYIRHQLFLSHAHHAHGFLFVSCLIKALAAVSPSVEVVSKPALLPSSL